MIRDRGRIKWNSLMLPEHVKMLRGWAKEDTYEQKKQLDEQQLELMDEMAAEAIEYGKTVTVTHYHNHHHELVLGVIQHYNPLEGKLQMVDRFEEIHTILLKNIVDIRFMEN
ncbi:YolD-like family protein [Heyndrickxia sp. NPDC080065]|uniref:YolD-like family protein n=1 Tax=Heyndrickxia sp. NPDC080065 TaxID=3390568 RepID=UPI003D020D67